jgi:hypothetical protein
MSNALKAKLKTGTTIGAATYDHITTKGIVVGTENSSTGNFDTLVQVESVKCADGIVNRIVLKKELAKQLGWTILEI